MEKGDGVPPYEGSQDEQFPCRTRCGIHRRGDLIRIAGERGSTDTREYKVRCGDRRVRLYGTALDGVVHTCQILPITRSSFPRNQLSTPAAGYDAGEDAYFCCFFSFFSYAFIFFLRWFTSVWRSSTLFCRASTFFLTSCFLASTFFFTS